MNDELRRRRTATRARSTNAQNDETTRRDDAPAPELSGGAAPGGEAASDAPTAPDEKAPQGAGATTETPQAPNPSESAAAEAAPERSGEADDTRSGDRATEPGAWAALHARRVRARRPGRGGRRNAPPEAAPDEPPADDGRDVIVSSAAPDEALLEASAAVVSPEAMAAAAADEEVTPARRRRRGRRGRGGAGGAGGGASAAHAPGAGVAPDETTAGSGALDTAPAAADVPPAVVDAGEGAPAETIDAAGDETEENPKRRHRGHRGGRRHRRKNGDKAADADGAPADAAEASDAMPATVAAKKPPAAPSKPAAAAAEAGAPQGAENGTEAIGGGAGEAPVAVEGAGPAPARRPRRRGRRGGGGSENGGEAADERQPAVATAERPAESERESTEPVGRRRGGRLRRQKDTGVTADLPGYKEILVSEDAGEMRVALVEDGRLAEIYIERPGKRSYAGNIYRGKVDNVLPGMDAAFVDIGLERNGFLYVDDIADPDDGEKRPRKITQMIKPGQELLVQVSKDPMGSKGARLTGQLSLAGRYLVYVPGGSGVGVSRRLPSDERDRLRELCKSLKAKNAGLIVRTVAEGKSVEEMKNDLRFLSRLWTRLKTKAEKVKAPGLVYAEADVSLQVARDLYNESFAAVLVDDPKRRKELAGYLEKVAPELATRVKLYEGEEPLFREHGIEEQIAKALERRVPLPSGGNLVIDHTEALTVIDVNTGRFTGGKGLEDTITRNNLEAAREVVRQLRLRDIGGIIIIDFIDMEFARNREAVLAKLQAELETDRTKTYVVEISPLGLVEMTRQNITDGARGILTQTCPVCEGKARVLSAETMAITIERRLGDHAAETQAKALLIEVNTAVAERLVGGGRIKRLERNTGRRFFLEGSKLLPIETFRIVAEGSLEAVESHRIPVREDQEVTVELEHALTYSPGDAVAHVDGFQLIVLNGRRALGERRKVRITSLTRAGAMGVILS